MAPSSRRSAPSLSRSTAKSTCSSTTTRSRQSQKSKQPQLKAVLNVGGFGRVSKLRTSVGFSDVEKGALENWDGDIKQKVDVELNSRDVVCEQTRDQTQLDESLELKAVEDVTRSYGAKRKRAVDSESESEVESRRAELPEQNKKRRTQKSQLLSPPRSRDGTDCDDDILLQSRVLASPRNRRVNAVLPGLVELPQSLRDLISMHAAFLKALSLHYAHNGASTPAELVGLMESTTRLWKKQNVRRIDVQRMLGLYEVSHNPDLIGAKQVGQIRSPFKMVTSGLGSSVRTNLEYIGQASFSDSGLQASYSDMVHNLFKRIPAVEDSDSLPQLEITLGTQTTLHRAKAASTRAEILSLSASAQSRSTPDFSKLSIIDPLEHTAASVKSRTLSLFDRVRAKGLASANNASPTSEQIMRRHAIGRIAEVVEFLRMKQQQKLSAQFHSSVHDSPGNMRGFGKASFSLGAIVKDIRQSTPVPIADEEVKLCLRILSKELPGGWCRMVELGTVVSVTLQGNGMSGIEVKKLLGGGMS